MFVKQQIINGELYCEYVESYRKDGQPHQIVIQKIGYIDPDETISMSCLEFHKEVAKEASLLVKEERRRQKEDFFSEKNPEVKNIGYLMIKYVLELFGTKELMDKIQSRYDFKYSLYDIFSTLVYSRILYPDSVLETALHRGDYAFLNEIPDYDYYRALTVIYENTEEIKTHFIKKANELFNLDLSYIYIDGSNIEFYVKYPDEDKINGDGEVVREGLRKYGKSKSGKHLPLLGFSLAVSRDGFPLDYMDYPGNRSEINFALPLFEETKRILGLNRSVLVADAGINSQEHIFRLSGSNIYNRHLKDGYIFGKSVRKADKEYKRFVLDPEVEPEIRTETDNKTGKQYLMLTKSRIGNPRVEFQAYDGKKHSIETRQKQIAYYSEKYANRLEHTRQRQLLQLNSYLHNPRLLFRRFRKLFNEYLKLIAKDDPDKDVSELVDVVKDEEKIEKDKLFDGFFSVVSSETGKSDAQILKIYRDKYIIEHMFRIMKKDLLITPVYLSLPEHIQAYLLIMFVSLITVRSLQKFTSHPCSVEEIQESLRHYECLEIQRGEMLVVGKDARIEDFETAFNISIPNARISKKDLKKNFSFSRIRKFFTTKFQKL